MRYLLATFIALASLQASSTVTYFIEDGKNVSGFESSDRELAEMALAAWSRESGGKLKLVAAAQESAAMVRVRWISPADGLYGEMQRTSINGKPVAIVNVSTSVAGLGEPIASMALKDRLLRDSIVYLTCVHETGHALGLQHTRNFEDIMYSFAYGGNIGEYFSRYRRNIKSRTDIPKFSGLSSGDIAVLKSLF